MSVAAGLDMKNISDCRLYTFVDTAYLLGRDPGDLARQLCEGGSDIIQLRAKDKTEAEVLGLAEKVLPVTRTYGIPLVINDFSNVASRIGADYCHLGQEDFFDAGFTKVSEVLGGSRLLFGLSTHDPAQAQRAIAANPAYIAIGPVFPTATKPEARPVTLDYVKWAAEEVQTPWFAIGGINLNNVSEVIKSGARRICVVSAILCAPDVERACREFKRLLVD